MVERYEMFSVAIAAIYKYIQKIERDEMVKFGLKGPHAQCLTTLFRFKDGLTSTQLCELCDKDKAAISRAVSELESKGLIYREKVNNNIYKALLKLTADGFDAAAHISDSARRAVEGAGKGMSESDRDVFYKTLNLLAHNIESMSTKGIPENESN
ncbi:MAG: winged helix-turn-helix transcriptional regulator [Oscillospiraceae bacterium]|nr:winged helix-turn-helix transcriptional regulator [Oscillospiraceae bacterium]